MKELFSKLYLLFSLVVIAIAEVGCANMIPPSGGAKDTLPPVLMYANPKDSTTGFTGNRISINFDEYVEVQNAYENVIVSPTPVNAPVINYKLKTVSVRLKDTLEPNTTYAINFGDAIRDVNEGNIYKDFTYVFSTGRVLDEHTFSGRVVLAETGKIDSTLIVVLHRNLDDSAVVKERPRYITKLNGRGVFRFNNLAAGTYAMYAIPNDFSRHYDDTTKPFAFAPSPVNTSDTTAIVLYAYQLKRIDTASRKNPVPPLKGEKDKQLRIGFNLQGARQDLLQKLELTFNKKVATWDTSAIQLTNEKFEVLNFGFTADTVNNYFVIDHSWVPDTKYNLLIGKTAFKDTSGTTLAKNDTVRFTTRRGDEYGSVKIRFVNLDLTKNPVLQIVQSDKVVDSVQLTQSDWYRKLFTPGDYELRILYDDNKNGHWDPGNFFNGHKQPEVVISVNTKLSVRGNWDNEKEIRF